MTLFSAKVPPLENKLIGHILREYPQMAKIMQRYFGKGCLERPGFKIQTLEMACLLFGIDQKRLLKEFGKIRN
jgi:hypothetical protein